MDPSIKKKKLHAICEKLKATIKPENILFEKQSDGFSSSQRELDVDYKDTGRNNRSERSNLPQLQTENHPKLNDQDYENIPTSSQSPNNLLPQQVSAAYVQSKLNKRDISIQQNNECENSGQDTVVPKFLVANLFYRNSVNSTDQIADIESEHDESNKKSNGLLGPHKYHTPSNDDTEKYHQVCRKKDDFYQTGESNKSCYDNSHSSLMAENSVHINNCKSSDQEAGIKRSKKNGTPCQIKKRKRNRLKYVILKKKKIKKYQEDSDTAENPGSHDDTEENDQKPSIAHFESKETSGLYILPKCNQTALLVPDKLNDNEEIISSDNQEELCASEICAYNAFPGMHLERSQGVMKRTPFLACKLCRNPYLNIGALLKHLLNKHNLKQNKHHGIHICITQAAIYFKESETRSSDLPMEFRGMCWLHGCEYGCTLGSPLDAYSDDALKPVACKECKLAFGSVSGVMQHLERDHDLLLLRHYLHICPEIYRKKKKVPTEVSSLVDDAVQGQMTGVTEEDVHINVKCAADSGGQPSCESTNQTSKSTDSCQNKVKLEEIQVLPPNREEVKILKYCKEPCPYNCSTKEKFVRGIKMAHIMACKKCKLAFYSLGSFINHMDKKHHSAKEQLHNYLHICCTVIKQYFKKLKEIAKKTPIEFFRRWYFYDNCRGDVCDFGCGLEKPFACKVCQLKFANDEEVVKHIDLEHDRVSIKPLLHICPSMLGDPPFRPLHDATKEKAITHHTFVPILNEVKKFATPIRPIQRKLKKKNSAVITTENEEVYSDDTMGISYSKLVSSDDTTGMLYSTPVSSDDTTRYSAENWMNIVKTEIQETVVESLVPKTEFIGACHNDQTHEWVTDESSGEAFGSRKKQSITIKKEPEEVYGDNSSLFDPLLRIKVEKEVETEELLVNAT